MVAALLLALACVGSKSADERSPEDSAPLDEPGASDAEGALLVVADEVLWRLTESADGVHQEWIADVPGYAYVNGADEVATLRAPLGDRVAVVDVETGASLGEVAVDGWAEQALWACGALLVANLGDAGEGQLERVELETGAREALAALGYTTAMLVEDEVVHTLYRWGSGYETQQVGLPTPCGGSPGEIVNLGYRASGHTLREGVLSAGRELGNEVLSAEVEERSAADGALRWSWSSEEGYSFGGVASIPGQVHALSLTPYQDWTETGPRAIWTLASGSAEPTRALELSCAPRALVPRDDGAATLWCLYAGVLWRATLYPTGEETWASTAASEEMTGVSDLVWTP